tara:strand:- start:44609 stop:45196 length:588 start_codon:yes stop_codon:yes gene_type:complete
MRDLREVGQKVIDSIMKTKPTDAGDLAIGVEDIISDLRSNPAQFQEKLDHLEGLFKELAYGEEYALREKAEDKEEDDVLGSLFGGYNGSPFASGVMPAISGAIMPGSLNTIASTGVSVKLPVSKQITAGYHTPPCSISVDNPCGEVPLGELEECSIPALTKEQLEALKEYEQLEETVEAVKSQQSWWKRWWRDRV